MATAKALKRHKSHDWLDNENNRPARAARILFQFCVGTCNNNVER